MRAALFVAAVLAAGIASPLLGQAMPARDAFGPVDCAAVSEHPARPRWLSLPLSRLVVNPTYTYSQAALPQFTGDALPLDLAYYTGAAPVRLSSFLSWELGTDAGPSQPAALTLAGWQRDSVIGDFAEGQVRFAATAGFGSLSRQVTVDLDRIPSLLIEVPSTAGAWAVKVSDGGGPAIALTPDTSQTGAFLLDVPAKTGWHGTKTFILRLFAIGDPSRATLISRLRFAASPALVSRAYAWAPQEVSASGTAADDSVSLETATTMPDANTVSQRLRVRKAGRIAPNQRPRYRRVGSQRFRLCIADVADNKRVCRKLSQQCFDHAGEQHLVVGGPRV